MAAGRIYTAEEVAQAIFQDSGSEFGGDASDSDFEDSQADNSDFQASSSSESADSEPTYMQVYGPRRELSLDESMVKFKGCIFFSDISQPNPLNGE